MPLLAESSMVSRLFPRLLPEANEIRRISFYRCWPFYLTVLGLISVYTMESITTSLSLI